MKQGALDTKWIVLGVIAVLLIGMVFWFVGTYNGLVSKDTQVDTAWANVQSQYQRRADLIPNLVNTVQGVVNFEQETQTKITALRSQALDIRNEIEAAQTPQQLSVAGQKLDSVVSSYRNLNINVENYPQLNAYQNFLSLQDQLEGTENRIQISREKYNEDVKVLNVAIKRFPSNLIAGWFGFSERDFFEAREGSDVVPVVNF